MYGVVRQLSRHYARKKKSTQIAHHYLNQAIATWTRDERSSLSYQPRYGGRKCSVSFCQLRSWAVGSYSNRRRFPRFFFLFPCRFFFFGFSFCRFFSIFPFLFSMCLFVFDLSHFHILASPPWCIYIGLSIQLSFLPFLPPSLLLLVHFRPLIYPHTSPSVFPPLCLSPKILFIFFYHD